MRGIRRRVTRKGLRCVRIGGAIVSTWCDTLACGHVMPMPDRYPDAAYRACRECAVAKGEE